MIKYNNKPIIYQYIKNRKGNLVGCVAAVDNDKIGYSLCNTNAGDVFNKKRAVAMAVGRANVNPVRSDMTTVPNSIHKHIVAMEERAGRYFKNSSEPVITQFVFKV